MRYKVTVSYDGNNYVGFQSQINGLAIQDVIEKALKKIFVKDIRIVMSSRTDAGVHAIGQVFHFDDERIIKPEKLQYAINSSTPPDIYISKVEYVDENFHARFSVKEKTYRYLINIGEYDVFKNGYAYQCHYKLDIDLMKEGAKLYLGTHDFGSFNTSSYSEYPNQVRTIKEFKIVQKKDMLYITVTGTGFLRNMVRIMVGTLIDLARGQKGLADVKKMVDVPSKNTRRYNVDPHGLYLVKIKY
ncbi:MAG: tRNA pseudouridine(38-40) synthase TruA [Firmicutes bacterium]|nr:tRNA pseudouridine(38-40) synthase TruA [Candidatus Colivicinus equi]